MRKFIAALAIASVAFLPACGGQDTGGQDTKRAEQQLVQLLERQVPGSEDVADRDLIDLGYSICDSFDEGRSVESVAMTGIDAGFTPYDTGYIIQVSVGTLCPEHQDMLDDFKDTYGEGSSTYSS